VQFGGGGGGDPAEVKALLRAKPLSKQSYQTPTNKSQKPGKWQALGQTALSSKERERENVTEKVLPPLSYIFPV
jgi:hypothetical protein